jgi:hypothetical protein
MPVALHLRRDGTFRLFYADDHYELQRGTWKPLSESEFVLESPWTRKAIAGPIRIQPGEAGDEWGKLREGLVACRDRHGGGDRIPAEELRSIQRMEIDSYGLGKRQTFRAEAVHVVSEFVSHEEVDRAIQALDAFVASDNKHRIRVRRLRQGSQTFLYWPEGGGGDWDLSEAQLHHAIDVQNNDSLRILFEIPRKEFPGRLPP